MRVERFWAQLPLNAIGTTTVNSNVRLRQGKPGGKRTENRGEGIGAGDQCSGFLAELDRVFPRPPEPVPLEML